MRKDQLFGLFRTASKRRRFSAIALPYLAWAAVFSAIFVVQADDARAAVWRLPALVLTGRGLGASVGGGEAAGPVVPEDDGGRRDLARGGHQEAFAGHGFITSNRRKSSGATRR